MSDYHLDTNTRFCAVLGHPVRHSISPVFQNAALDRLHLNWRYIALEVLPQNLSQSIQGCKAMGFIGLNLTIPHKEQAFGLVDVVDESARTLGAINTIRFEALSEEGQWKPIAFLPDTCVPETLRSVGYNTDTLGFSAGVREGLGLNLHGLKVLLLGTGGAGRVAAHQLAKEGISKLWIINRTQERAQSVAAEIKQHHSDIDISLSYPSDKEDVDLLINATSLGLRDGDPLPYDEHSFSLRQVKNVFDMVYRPHPTPLLEEAHRAGCQWTNGVPMLVYQGLESLRIWSGNTVPYEAMRSVLKHELGF